MKEYIIYCADYIIMTNKTLREAANDMGISKSELHRILNIKLKEIDYARYLKIKSIFSEHNKYRHIKGGEATRLKFCLKE